MWLGLVFLGFFFQKNPSLKNNQRPKGPELRRTLKVESFSCEKDNKSSMM